MDQRIVVIILEAIGKILSLLTEGAPAPPLTSAPPPPPGTDGLTLKVVPDEKPVDTEPEELPEVPEASKTPADLDSSGLPWDERINTTSKTKLKNGEWRVKPGSDAAFVAQVKTELRGKFPGVGEPLKEGAPGVMSWGDLLGKVVALGKTPEEVQQACAAVGCENIGKLQDSPLLVPQVAMILGIVAT